MPACVCVCICVRMCVCVCCGFGPLDPTASRPAHMRTSSLPLPWVLHQYLMRMRLGTDGVTPNMPFRTWALRDVSLRPLNTTHAPTAKPPSSFSCLAEDMHLCSHSGPINPLQILQLHQFEKKQIAQASWINSSFEPSQREWYFATWTAVAVLVVLTVTCTHTTHTTHAHTPTFVLFAASIAGAALFSPTENSLYEGLYSVHLRHWFKHFSTDHFKLFIFDDFFHNTERTCSQLVCVCA